MELDSKGNKPRLLVLSHVLPFPRRNGQQQRVFYTLQAARERFHVTFLTVVDPPRLAEVREELLTVCDDVILLKSRYANPLTRWWHRSAGLAYSVQTGLKFSNYLVGKLELSPARVAGALNGCRFDCVLFEYWHANAAVPMFQEKNIPCVLDMHNVLWQSHLQKLEANPSLAEWWKRHSIRNYQLHEEDSWKKFDGVIAITREEHAYAQPRVAKDAHVFYAPMGVDLSEWEFDWQPATPPRIAFYGGMASLHNQEAAVRCYRQVMPEVWRRFPHAELWLVGSNPPAHLQALASDPRVRVTGFVEKVQDVLRSMSTVLCPWIGTYGFRSRLVEVMALGVPVVATPDAVNGMELTDGQGLLLGAEDEAMSKHVQRLLENADFARSQSQAARAQVEFLYGMPNTYGRLTEELESWLESKRAVGSKGPGGAASTATI